jgi:hypothetical protein
MIEPSLTPVIPRHHDDGGGSLGPRQEPHAIEDRCARGEFDVKPVELYFSGVLDRVTSPRGCV